MKRATQSGLIREHVFATVEEMLAGSDQSRKAGHDRIAVDHPAFIGRQFESWDEVMANANGDWPEGQRIVAEMLRELEGVEIERPATISRRRAGPKTPAMSCAWTGCVPASRTGGTWPGSASRGPPSSPSW